MARPIKEGVDYFSFDVGFLQDIKIKAVMNAYGGIAALILIALLCNIYKDKGYYIRFSDELTLVVAVDIGTKECTVTDVILKAVKVGFFDENIFEKYGILTSKGIQKRYFAIVSRRKEVNFHREIMLLNINDDNNLVNVCNNSINVCNSTQSKVKESKVKKSIRDMSHDVIDDSVSTTTKTTTTKNNSSISSKKFRRPTLDELIAYIKEKGYVFDPEAFMSYYDANGWRVGRNPMKSWKAACAYWNKNEKSVKGKKPIQGSQSLSREDLDIIKDF